MQPFWEGFVSFVPLTVAPNLLTLLALAFNFSALMVYLPFDSTLSMQFPKWTYVYSAFCVFMYQTFDAIDGKQARRTKTSGPLGQLFDHGCDAVNTSFIVFLMG